MYEIILYDTEDGRCPVQELLDSLEPKLLAKTLRTIDLLEMNGPLLREPYSKPLENGIFVASCQAGIRYYKSTVFLYCRQEGGTDQWIYKKIAEDTKGRKRTGKEV